MQNANFYAVLDESFSSNATRVALETQSGATFSYAEIGRAVERYAGALHTLRLQPGDRIAVQLEKSPQALFLYLACLRAGLIYVPLNTAYRPAELSYFLSDAEPSVIVVGPDTEAEVAALVQAHGMSARILTIDSGGSGTLPDLVERATAFSDIAAA